MADVDFEEVYRTCFRQVYAYVFSLCGNRHLTEEVTQETFFKALEQLDRFRGDCKISVWLCQIAKNTLFSLHRKKKETSLTDNLPAEELFDRLLSKEDAFQLHQLLHTLEEPYKEVFSLRVFGELSFAEIAALFDKSESWARVTYFRAKHKILDLFEVKQNGSDHM